MLEMLSRPATAARFSDAVLDMAATRLDAIEEQLVHVLFDQLAEDYVIQKKKRNSGRGLVRRQRKESV